MHPAVRGARRYVDSLPEIDPDQVEERGPSVIGANALVVGLMQLRLQALTLGTTPDATTGTQRYHILEGLMSWGPIKECRVGCGRAHTIAMGDSLTLPLGIDLDREQADLRWTSAVGRPRAASARAKVQSVNLEVSGDRGLPEDSYRDNPGAGLSQEEGPRK